MGTVGVDSSIIQHCQMMDLKSRLRALIAPGFIVMAARAEPEADPDPEPQLISAYKPPYNPNLNLNPNFDPSFSRPDPNYPVLKPPYNPDPDFSKPGTCQMTNQCCGMENQNCCPNPGPAPLQPEFKPPYNPQPGPVEPGCYMTYERKCDDNTGLECPVTAQQKCHPYRAR